MSTKYIADLHCHTSLKPFRNPPKNLWETLDKPKKCGGLIINLAKLNELITESRTNLDKCVEGKVRLLFITLMPVERSTFDLKCLGDLLINEKKVGRCISGFSETYIEEILESIKDNSKIDYFSELIKEYQYLKGQEIVGSNGHIFKLAANYEEAIKLINESDKTIVGILTIEGAHAFNIYEHYEDILGTKFKEVDNEFTAVYKHYEAKFEAGITGVKTIMGDNTPFFANLTHHFWNLLCGHAQSYNGLIASIGIKQERFANRGITKLGKKVINLLLSRENGRRILIDTKHMSLVSRKEFYHIWETEFEAKGDAFPIICSHAAVNGKDNFEEDAADFIKKQDKKKKKRKRDKDKHRKGYYFNRWSINLYDEDIRMIAKSKGIIGIILHEDRLPGDFANDRIQVWLKRWRQISDGMTLKLEDGTILNKDQIKGELEDAILQVILANIFHIVKVCNDQTGWDLIGLGTDFDGIINSFECYDDFI
ncbi:MAG: membrane dipeptidase, partial [Chitinophagales bacterium]